MFRPSLAKNLRGLITDRKGGVLIIGALALPVVIAMAALVAEFGGALTTKVQNQRVADLAAYAGAMAYSQAQSQSDMTAAAQSVAALNGIPAADLSVSLVASPRTSGSQAVNVTVATQQPLFLARVISNLTNLNVRAASYAEFSATPKPGCIYALSSSETGVTLSGGTSIDAPNCSVSSNNTVTVPCGTSITATTVNYNSATAPSQPCGGIKTDDGSPAPLTKTYTPDPLAGNAGVTSAVAHIAAVKALSAVSPLSGGDINFAWNQTLTKNQAAADGCTASFSGSTWTLTCTGRTNFNFGNITTGGGINVSFNVNGDPATTYNFSGSINNSGTVMTLGPGTYNIAQGITTGGNSKTIFGSGNTNSFSIGPSSSGTAISVGNGAQLYLGDALDTDSVFNIVGNIVTGGGSCLTLSAAKQHDIKGSLDTSGGLTLGAGVYTFDGYFALGANYGGSVSCNGQDVSLNAQNVSLVLSGNPTHSSGFCKGYAFCAGAGYSGMTLVSPSSGTMKNLAIIGPSDNSAGAYFAAGASGGAFSGALYFPNGPVAMSGGASVGGATGGCLEIIGSRVTLSGGTTAASECISSSASGNGKVSLVQ